MEEVTPQIAEEVTEVFSEATDPASEEVVATEEPTTVEEPTPEPEVVAPAKTKSKKTSAVEPTPEPVVVVEEQKPQPTISKSGGITIARSTKTN